MVFVLSQMRKLSVSIVVEVNGFSMARRARNSVIYAIYVLRVRNTNLLRSVLHSVRFHCLQC